MGDIFLKCDAPGCDHTEAVDHYEASLIGKTCPKCGAVILTQDDYDASLPIFSLMKFLEAVSGDETAESRRVMVNPHAGDINVKIFAPEPK